MHDSSPSNGPLLLGRFVVPFTNHVIFSKELFFHPCKSYLVICTRLFETLNRKNSQEIHHMV